MKPIQPFLIATCVIAGAVGILSAQELGSQATTGKVLLLRGGSVMEGEIEKVGAQLRIRNGASEIWISCDKAVRLCADWDDAYVYAQSVLKLDSADDRVKLARWCHMNRLPVKALQQAKYALELRPGHPDALQIVSTLERSSKNPTPKAAIAVVPSVSTSIRPKPATVSIDVGTETQLSFASKVQPILMNTCASCHCTGRGGNWELERVTSPTQKLATQRNLAKILTYIDLERPNISPLLERAIKAHGGAELAAIPNRDAKAFQSLKQWVDTTIARNPQLKDYAAVQRTPADMTPSQFATGVRSEADIPNPKSGGREQNPVGAEQKSEARKQETTNVKSADRNKEAPARDQFAEPTARVPQIDMHDPATFNEFYHPKR